MKLCFLGTTVKRSSTEFVSTRKKKPKIRSMNIQEKTVAGLIEYIDHVEASLLADYDHMSRQVTAVDNGTLTNLQRSDLLWDLAAVKADMVRVHTTCKQLQTTLRGIQIASKKI